MAKNYPKWLQHHPTFREWVIALAAIVFVFACLMAIIR